MSSVKCENYHGICPTNYLSYDNKDEARNTIVHVNYMLARTRRMFKWSNLPDTIPERNLELMIQSNGHVCIAEHEGKIYAFTGSFGGVPNEYYMPTKYIVSNPYLNFTKEYTIGEDCVIIGNDSMFLGIIPILSKYGRLLSKTELTMGMIVTLARAALVIDAEDESELRSALDYIDKLSRGELGIITRDRLLQGDKIQVQPGATAAANVFTNLIELCQYWRAIEFNEVGLNANWNAKRESITSSEAILNTDSLSPLCDDMKKCRLAGIELANEKFGLNMSVDFDSAWESNEKELDLNEQILENEADETADKDNTLDEGDDIDDRRED